MGTKKGRIYGKGGATEVWGGSCPKLPPPTGSATEADQGNNSSHDSFLCSAGHVVKIRFKRGSDGIVASQSVS